MIPGDFHKLVGGYATGTLTPEERQTLFQAALEDQGIFDALAREEALRDVLSEPAARARLLAALDRRRGWWGVPVLPLAAAAALSIGVLAGYWAWHSRPRPAVREVAAVRPVAARGAAENGPASAPTAKPVAPVRRLPARSAPVRQRLPGTATVEPVAPSPSGTMGSLAPAPMPPPASEAQVQAPPNPVEMQPAKDTVASGAPVPRPLQSGAAGNSFRPARNSIMSLGGASTASPLRWTVLRRRYGEPGAFEPIEPGQLRQGDTVELRLESTLEGEISVAGGPPLGMVPMALADTHIVPGQTVVTPPIEPGGSGERVLTLRLTRPQAPPILLVVRLNYR
ncbi:MAG: hypothetical protein ABSH56_26925 [Bryobacteraceae bacterium]